jgi:phage terminase small subunit
LRNKDDSFRSNEVRRKIKDLKGFKLIKALREDLTILKSYCREFQLFEVTSNIEKLFEEVVERISCDLVIA